MKEERNKLHPALVKINNTSAVKTFEVNKITKERKKLFIKMNLLETVDEEVLVLDMFEHLGELKLYSHILKKCKDSENSLYYHNSLSMQEIEEKLSLQKSTQHKYIKQLVSKGLLIKKQNGIYLLNKKFIELQIH